MHSKVRLRNVAFDQLCTQPCVLITSRALAVPFAQPHPCCLAMETYGTVVLESSSEISAQLIQPLFQPELTEQCRPGMSFCCKANCSSDCSSAFSSAFIRLRTAEQIQPSFDQKQKGRSATAGQSHSLQFQHQYAPSGTAELEKARVSKLRTLASDSKLSKQRQRTQLHCQPSCCTHRGPQF